MKQEREGFRFKSFMIEMILSHLADSGLDFSDYPEALQHFFTYIAKSDLQQQIVFADYYAPRTVGRFIEPVQIIDPVNKHNNVSRLYARQQADAIVDAALDAGDTIDAALAAPTKQETLRYWQKVFGRRFRHEVIKIMSTSFTYSDTVTFSHTHAVHLAAKVAADLKRMQRLYAARRIPASRTSRRKLSPS
jgi:hypothetical protein